MKNKEDLATINKVVVYWTRLSGIPAGEFTEQDDEYMGDENAMIKSLAHLFMSHAEAYDADIDDAKAAANECVNNPIGNTPPMRYKSMIDRMKNAGVGMVTLAMVGPYEFTKVVNARTRYWNEIMLCGSHEVSVEYACMAAKTETVSGCTADEVACDGCLRESLDIHGVTIYSEDELCAMVRILTFTTRADTTGNEELDVHLRQILARRRMLYGI